MRGDGVAAERTEEHRPLGAEVDDARALGDGLPQARVHDGRAAADGSGEEIDDHDVAFRGLVQPRTATSRRPMRMLTLAAGRPELICRLLPETAIAASTTEASSRGRGLCLDNQLARNAT